jgi:hypothetical protein
LNNFVASTAQCIMAVLVSKNENDVWLRHCPLR